MTPPEKRPLQAMFNAVPQRYDLVNRVTTWGLDSRWRRLAASICLAKHPARVLDLACGTGDLAITTAALAGNDSVVVGVDFSWPMLAMALSKPGVADTGGFICGEAAALPFPDGSFDCVGTSFAFRNLTYRNPGTAAYLAEVRRVLCPGGRFVIVETSQPRNRLLRSLFHAYLRWLVRPIGSQLSGNSAAYHYLTESASRFYSPEELADLLANAGFRRTRSQPLIFGIVAIHTTEK
jgi:demethylmenaquinone methyltransferase/2-methoxy-6-polyprenyl-1,4-benzoquinol methylase